MKIGIPVVCQNGHPSTWVIEVVGLEALGRGATESCACPKFDRDDGWRPSGGDPFVIQPEIT